MTTTKPAMKATIQSYRDLHVWQRSMELTVAVYRLTEAFPRGEVFGLTSQLRRSAVSIPSNIAEGLWTIKPARVQTLSSYRPRFELRATNSTGTLASLRSRGFSASENRRGPFARGWKDAFLVAWKPEDHRQLNRGRIVSLFLYFSVCLPTVHCPLEQL